MKIIRMQTAEHIIKALDKGKTLISIDQAGIKVGMSNENGWSQVGVDAMHFGVPQWENLSIMAAIDHEKTLCICLKRGFFETYSVMYFFKKLIKMLEKNEPN